MALEITYSENSFFMFNFVINSDLKMKGDLFTRYTNIYHLHHCCYITSGRIAALSFD